MSRSSTRFPVVILGSAIIGAFALSLLLASPTPAQVGAAPTATYTTAGHAAPATPTPTTRPPSSAPTQAAPPTQAAAATPTPTLNLSSLPGIPGMPNIPDLSQLSQSMAQMLTALPQQMATGNVPGQTSALQGAAPTPTPTAMASPTGAPTQITPTATATSAVASTTASIVVSPTAGTLVPTHTPVPTPSVVADALPGAPMLTIDSPEPGGTIANGRSVLVGGWIVDPRMDSAGVVAVDVFVDGQPETGTFVGAAEHGLVRADVAGYFQRPGWERSGFDFEWTPRGLTPGQHRLVVVAQLAAGGTAVAEIPFSAR